MTDSTTMIKGFDLDGLYVVEKYTDLVSGDIDVLTPVTKGRVRDTKRPIRFFSSVMAMYRGMQMKVAFEIPASDLEEAISKFPTLGELAARQQIEAMEKQNFQNQIISPPGMLTAKPRH